MSIGSAQKCQKYPNLQGKQILVVEDEAVLAVDYYFQLRAVGATPVAYEPTTKAALNFMAVHEVDAAIVDYRLRDGGCHRLLQLLLARGIPFIVVSGFAEEIGAMVDTERVLCKPVAPADLYRALSSVLS
jgi:CheY-like chemotaxis protein